MPYKLENWHTLSHEQNFAKRCFLEICRCAFNQLKIFLWLKFLRDSTVKITKVYRITKSMSITSRKTKKLIRF